MSTVKGFDLTIIISDTSCAPCNLMASGSDFDSFEIKRAYIRQARKLADDEVETA